MGLQFSHHFSLVCILKYQVGLYVISPAVKSVIERVIESLPVVSILDQPSCKECNRATASGKYT